MSTFGADSLSITASHCTPARGVLGVLRKVFSFPSMLVAWIVLIVVRLAERNLPDVDLWWHLRNAEYLFTHHALPRFDSYSFTAAGQPLINHEWLAEIPYYLAWRALGLEGIEIFMLVLLEAIFLGVLYLCYQRSGHIKASILACWFAVFLATINFGPRTVLFGYLYLVILLSILERFRSRGRALLWLLPPLFCLWINTHGSWSFGLIAFGIFIVSGLVEGEWGVIQASRWSPRQLRQLRLACGASCAALFVNPYGYRLVFYPLDLAIRQHFAVASVQEWASTDFHALRGKVVLVLLGGLFVSALVTRHRWKLSDLLLVLFGFYCGLTYERFLFLAGIIAAPLVAELLHVVPRYRPEIDKPWLNAAIIFGVLAFVVYRFPGPAELEQMVAEQYPAEIVPYLEAHPPSGPVLNYYEWGAYLGWKDPQFKVFVDSRVDIFEYSGVFKDYVNIAGFNDPLAVIDKYRIRYVLFPARHPLIYLLERDRNWKFDFKGDTTTLLERAGPLDGGALNGARAGREKGRPWPGDPAQARQPQ